MARKTSLEQKMEMFLANGALGLENAALRAELAAAKAERDALAAHVERLREVLETLNYAAKVAISREYGSSFDEETPLVIRLLDGTCDATDAALSSTPTTAEWLAARDAEQRRIGAAEELEKLGEWCRCGDINPDDARDEIARACKNRAAQLRKGE